MARYKPVDPHLSKMLPVRFADQILPGTFEYAVNWLVDHEIDLTVFDARYRNDETGASAYHPSVLLKVVLLGYARGLVSSRAIARACRENVVFMALSGDSAPHFTTIASFISKLSVETTAVFRDVLLVCDEQGLIGKELFAVDGCKLPSNASRTWSGTRAELAKKTEKMEKAVVYLLDTHRRQDAGQNEDALSVRERHQIETLSRNSQKIRSALADFKPRLNRKGEELKSNLTDPDSAVMKTSHGVVQGYTGVAAVDAKSQIVVHATAHGTGQENGLLPAVVTALRDDFAAMGQADPLASATDPHRFQGGASALQPALGHRRAGVWQSAHAPPQTIHPAVPSQSRCAVEALCPRPQCPEAAKQSAAIATLEPPENRAMVNPTSQRASRSGKSPP